MFLKRTLAVLLSATMLFGMTSLSTTAATTDTEAVSAGNYYNASFILKIMRAMLTTNRISVQTTAKAQQSLRYGHRRHLP